jgi:acyl carrier protein
VLAGKCGAAAWRLAGDEDLLLATGLDSLDALEVLAHIETEFGIRFQNRELQLPSRLAELVAKVQRACEEMTCESA